MAEKYSFEGKTTKSVSNESPLVFMFQPHTFELIKDDPEVLKEWERLTAERCGVQEMRSNQPGCSRSISMCGDVGFDDSDCINL